MRWFPCSPWISARRRYSPIRSRWAAQAGVDAAQRLRQPPGLHLVVADGKQEMGRRQAGVEPDGLLERVDGRVPPALDEPLAADQEVIQCRDRGSAGGQLLLPGPAVGIAEPGQERGASQVVGGGRIIRAQTCRAVEDLQPRGRLDGPGEDQQQVVTPLDDRPLLDVRDRIGQLAGQGPALVRRSAGSRVDRQSLVDCIPEPRVALGRVQLVLGGAELGLGPQADEPAEPLPLGTHQILAGFAILRLFEPRLDLLEGCGHPIPQVRDQRLILLIESAEEPGDLPLNPGQVLGRGRLATVVLQAISPDEHRQGPPALLEADAILAKGPADRQEERSDSHGPQGGDGRAAAGPLGTPLERRGAVRVDRLAVAEPRQIFGQGPGRGITPRRLLAQAFQADGLQVARHSRDEPRGRHDLGLDDLPDRLDGVLPLEGRPAREQLVEDRPQRVDVGGRADVPDVPPGLLGGHVAGRAHDRRRSASCSLSDSIRLARPKSVTLGIPSRGRTGCSTA